MQIQRDPTKKMLIESQDPRGLTMALKQGARVRCTLTHSVGKIDYTALAPELDHIPVTFDEGLTAYCHIDDFVTVVPDGSKFLQ
ncbi:MAG: hypothetical protein EOP06_01090 [Proteobacteria bacterium]|nr:MAG: hypothetical protein EOP06_01090 [Pseudomonadota bacterium]